MVPTHNYTIWISRPDGSPLAVVGDIVRLEYRRIVNQSGLYRAANTSNVLPLRLVVPAAALPLQQIGRDTRLEIWRTAADVAPRLRTAWLETDTVWLVQQVRLFQEAGAAWLVELGAVPALALLERRLVAYPVGSPQATKSGPADDVARALVRENLGSAAADIARELSDWLTIAPDQSRAPVVSIQCARRNLLEALQDVAVAAAQAGTPLWFDVMQTHSGRFQFCTYVGARGADRSYPAGLNPVLLSPDTGTLIDIEQHLDYTDEATVIYAAGQGAESERLMAETSDPARMMGSPFGRRERLLDARHLASPAALTDAAQTALAAAWPRRTLRAAVVDMPGLRYGQHWRWGDRVTAVIAGEPVACHIDEVHVTIAEGREQVRAWLRVEGSTSALAGALTRRQAAPEREVTYQQVQRGALPQGALLMLPPQGHLLVYGRYDIAGGVLLEAGARLVVLV
jgi:hypothetical protein